MAGSDGIVGRTAIVVVEGIGDQPTAAGSETVYRRLVGSAAEHWYPGGQSPDWFAGKESFGVAAEDPQPVTRYRLRGHDGAGDVDVYEFYWADLSRFASATRSFIVATYSLFLEVGAIGHAALREGSVPLGPLPITQDLPRADRFHVAGAILALLEWMLAVPILLTGFMIVLLLGGGLLSLRLSGSGPAATYTALAAYGAVASGIAIWWLRSYSRERRRPWIVAGPLLAVAVGGSIWSIALNHGNATVGIADVTLLIAAYPFRLAWITLGVLALGFLVALAICSMRRGEAGIDRRRVATAILSLGGAFGVALFTAIIFASVGVIFNTIASSPIGAGGQLLCLPQLTDWWPGPCSADVAQTASSWGMYLFGELLVPLVFVVLLVVIALLVAVVGTVGGAAVRGLLRQSPFRPAINHVPPLIVRITNYLVWVVPPCALVVVVAWLPFSTGLVDTAAGWVGVNPKAAGGLSVPAALAALTGYAVAACLAAARVLGLGAAGMGTAEVNPGVRSAMDSMADVLNFLREPSRLRGSNAARFRAPGNQDDVQPRQRLMSRFAALMAYVNEGGSEGVAYQRVVFFAHSQGTVLTTCLLSVDSQTLPLPPECALVTAGSPLWRLMWWRLPHQFAWVGRLATPDGSGPFVTGVNQEWVNFGADGDFVGRSVFGSPADPPTGPGQVMTSGSSSLFKFRDVSIGPGDHGSYWSDATVYAELARLALIHHPATSLSGAPTNAPGRAVGAAGDADRNQ